MIGTTLAHYRITAALGAGGMGEVWRATDEKLGREVALKVLSEEFASDPHRLDRFEREARAVAALNHPHIVTIHSVEEAEGVRFLTMELVDGETLDALIPKDGLEIERFFDLATPLAEAVSAAHDKSVIHRDLKPTNVMVDRDGRVKVMDFGLAKVAEAGEVSDSSELPTEALTGIGMIVGTVPYMSPEQIEGEIVDHRTDIFSLGVLLYEMAIGERPFQGKSSPSLMSSILKDAPTPVVELRTDLPRHLGRIIGRCLEKNRRDRYQTARDVFNELKALQREASTSTGAAATLQPRSETSPTSSMEPSSGPRGTTGVSSASGTIPHDEGFWVAVLPFKYSGGDAGITALAEGLSEEIGSGLSRFSYLRVVAQGSRVVDARYVLEGSLRQAGAKLRLAVQLVDTTTGAHLWAEAYDRTFSPEALFELQDDLVPRIVSTVADMHGILPRQMSETVRLKPADQLTPYESLLHSFGYNERFTPDSLAEARTCLERAVEQSPGNADCWAMLSLMYSNEFGHYDIRHPESFDKALEAARKAVLAAPLHSLPQYALAQALFFRRDFAAARTAAERAVALNPMDGATAAFMGLLIAYSGEWERGCVLAERAWELNPNLPGMFNYTAWHDAYRKEDYRRALELALELNTPQSFYQHAVLTMCYAQLGEMNEAHKSLRAMLAIKPDYGKVARQLHGKWIQPDLVERLMDGLRKAGLEIADEEEEQLEADPAVSDSGEQRADEGFWVAVLPFKFTGGDEDISALAEGLSDDIVSGLSRFSYLRVIARGSTTIDPRYVIEGSIRLAGSMLRISVQLMDTSSGAHLWAETFDRPFRSEAIFELQDELVPRIVSTVGDAHGILPHTMSESLRSAAPDQLTPYEAVLRSFGYGYRRTAAEHATVRAGLERAVEQAPRYADAWAMLALVYVDEQAHGYNLRPDPVGRALQAANRAVEAAPSNAMGYNALAWAMFFRKEFQAFRTAAEQSFALNPLNSPTLAGLGALTSYSGDWERGCALVERATQLNSRHPGWYWLPLFYNAYRNGDYRDAVNLALKFNLPDFFVTHEALAAAYGQLGEHDAAGQALREMHRLKPDYAETGRERLEKWFDEELVEHMMDGLRKAGLDVPPSLAHGSPSTEADLSRPPDSGVARTDEGFWVAVLPFKFSGSDADLSALAEGLSEDIVTGLSRFSYLRVVAGSSNEQYSGESRSVQSGTGEADVRYVMEGSLRRAGSRLRIAVQLVDATTGAHLWAENFERAFSSEAAFELQDDLVPRIVSTVADIHGILPRSMGEAVRSRDADRLSPYEAVLRSFAYFSRVTAEELAAARAPLELALQHAPDYADAWAMLALLCAQEYGQGFDLLPDSLALGETAARRAVEAGPSNHLAHFSLAQVLFFQKDFQAFRNSAERAVTLNPMDGNSVAFLGELLTYAGDAERGLAMAKRAKRLNPNHPGWYWYADLVHAYRQRDYSATLEFASKVNLPGHWGLHCGIAAACAQLGDRETAQKALKTLLDLRPDFADIGRRELEKWWDSEFVEHVVDGLRKAGLEIANEEEQPEAVPVLSDSGEQRADEGFWVAVLPFKYTGADDDLNAFAEGLSEDIVTGMSRFSYLRVIARGSTTTDARYVMEGSLRQAGKKLRVAVQLVDTDSGAHLWAEAYDRDFEPDELFALQDDIISRVVSTCADHFGVLARAISEAVRGKPVAEMTPYEALMRGFGYHFRLTPEEHAEARDALEQAVKQAPSNADCWAMLSWIYSHEFAHGFNPRPGSLDRALAAARRAVDLAPSNHLAQQVLAVALFFRKETAACLSAAERSMALNPYDGSNEAFFITCFAGDWDRGCALIRRAMELNPHHPRWYELQFAFDEYRKENYRAAVDEAVNANASDLFWTSWLLAAAYGQLGDLAAARKALDDLLSQKEDFARTGRDLMERWFEPKLVEHFTDGLRKAGLVIGEPAAAEAATSGRAAVPSGGVAPSPPSIPPSALRPFTDQAFAPTQQESAETKSIVVLPFANLSPDPDTEYFSDGLTDEIITDLSRVRDLRVISRSSAMRLKGDGRDLAAIGRDLDCQYVLEGSVRRAANTLRMTARLVDAPNDVQLWADKYRGTLDDVFDIQERVSRSIVDALEIRLTPQEAEQLADRPIPDVRAQECYLRARREIWSFLPGGVDMAISHLEAGLALIGDNTLLYQGLGEAYFQSINIGAAGGREEEYIKKAESCAEKIFALEPESTRGSSVRAHLQLARGDIHGCLRSWRHVLQAFPKDVQALQLTAHILGWLGGKPDAAAPLAAQLVDIDPLDPMSRLASLTVPLFAGRFTEALEPGRRMFDLDPVTPVWRSNYVMALSYNQRFDEAEELTEGVVAQPDSDIGTWWMGLCRAAWREDRAEVLRLADGPYQQAAAWDAEIPWVLASAHAAVGVKEEALLWLDRAIDQGMINYPFLSEHDHYLDSIRGDERFGRAMERARREWELFDV